MTPRSFPIPSSIPGNEPGPPSLQFDEDVQVVVVLPGRDPIIHEVSVIVFPDNGQLWLFADNGNGGWRLVVAYAARTWQSIRPLSDSKQ